MGSQAVKLNVRNQKENIELLKTENKKNDSNTLNLPIIKNSNSNVDIKSNTDRNDNLKYDFNNEKIKKDLSLKILNSIANSNENIYRKKIKYTGKVTNILLNDFIDTPNTEIVNTLKKDFNSK